MTKRKRDTQESKRRLLETAEKIFVIKGFDGARVDQIAGEAGVNKRMIYVWYGNKERLYIEVLRNAFVRLFESSWPDLESCKGDSVGEIETLVRWYFWFLSDNPSFVRLLGWETLGDGQRAGTVLTDLMGVGLKRIQDVIRQGKDKGVFRKDIAAHKMVTILNEMCLGYFSRLKLLEMLWKQDLSTRDRQSEMLEQIMKIVLDGLRAR
jgi:AcrR family transcriptional regulator